MRAFAFRGHPVAAPLKHGGDPALLGLLPSFRGHPVAAPLKLLQDVLARLELARSAAIRSRPY